jgi:hypothetical protein
MCQQHQIIVLYAEKNLLSSYGGNMEATGICIEFRVLSCVCIIHAHTKKRHNKNRQKRHICSETGPYFCADNMSCSCFAAACSCLMAAHPFLSCSSFLHSYLESGIQAEIRVYVTILIQHSKILPSCCLHSLSLKQSYRFCSWRLPLYFRG